ncbi:uncharacterized protein LOC131321744 [Rhododendron vialii]|uniref:uncharacterized protein LOC131321744 n=1 Tax=Rhododendron vialii TaxID=182163 RepID=UPI00265EB51F|nr:uncharacterized protein LOC131321744 [Rhododendron vialii]
MPNFLVFVRSSIFVSLFHLTFRLCDASVSVCRLLDLYLVHHPPMILLVLSSWGLEIYLLLVSFGSSFNRGRGRGFSDRGCDSGFGGCGFGRGVDGCDSGFGAHEGHRSGGGGRGHSRDSKLYIYCWGTNHTVEYCYHLHGFPQAHQVMISLDTGQLAHSSANNVVTISAKEYQRLMSIQPPAIDSSATAMLAQTESPDGEENWWRC